MSRTGMRWGGLILMVWLMAAASGFAQDEPGLGDSDKAIMRQLYEKMPPKDREAQRQDLLKREEALNERSKQAPTAQVRIATLSELQRVRDELTILSSLSENPFVKTGSLIEDYAWIAIAVAGGLALLWVGRRGWRRLQAYRAGKRERGDIPEIEAEAERPPVALQDIQSHLDHIMISSRVPYNAILEFLFEQAVVWHASDIHIQRGDQWVEVKFRIDGQLYDVGSLDVNGEREILNIIKNMARLKLFENRAAQEGRLEYFINGRWYDFRVSIVPVHDTEKVVARIFGDEEIIYELDRLGLSIDTTERMKDILKQKHGLILVVGPAGSGKTTSIYSFLNYLYKVRGGINITTLEDPVEHTFSHLSQVQINPGKNLTFEHGFANLLRQDPEVIMIGEIRETSVAQLVVRAAQTGHLIISTIHSPTTAGAVDRLLELGVDPYALFGILNGVLSQRLVKKVCSHCLKPYTPDPALEKKALALLGPGTAPIWRRGVGCEACMGKGFRGRVAVDELLAIPGDAREKLAAAANRVALRSSLDAYINHSLYRDAVLKAAGGLTTLEDIESVLGDLTTDLSSVARR